ncbi:hypothetical protein EK21DRAFT_89130 [Setomelanomma holmii]|uniref:Uncharacterized protein n=1 Tax=Setomelanomma holmii TaxID=210430 RepID=A0A9P4HAN0_9PLEO|nr:hypothetical protein EK21DRAFT_89130 [Setomelanomma holmii]
MQESVECSLVLGQNIKLSASRLRSAGSLLMRGEIRYERGRTRFQGSTSPHLLLAGEVDDGFADQHGAQRRDANANVAELIKTSRGASYSGSRLAKVSAASTDKYAPEVLHASRFHGFQTTSQSQFEYHKLPRFARDYIQGLAKESALESFAHGNFFLKPHITIVASSWKARQMH